MFRIYGNPEKNDLGVWVDFGPDTVDPSITVRFRVRAVPDPVNKSLGERFGGEERVMPVTVDDKTFQAKMRIPSADQLDIIGTERAMYAWVDCENLSVLPADQEGASYLRSKLKPVDGAEQPAAGHAIVLDGRLTDDVKRYLLQRIPELRGWINETANKIAEGKIRDEKALLGNS